MNRKKGKPIVSGKKQLDTNPIPEGLSGFELDVRRRERLKTVAILQRSRTPLAVIEVSAEGTAFAEQAIVDAKKKYPPPALDCKEGCDWCCHLTVGTSVPEIVRIVDFLKQTFTEEELQTIRERVRQVTEQRQALRPKVKSPRSLPCVFLHNHRCMIYPVRPLTCRGSNSTNVSQCEQFLEPRNKAMIPMYVPQHRLTAFVLDGMRAGLQEIGLKGDLLELTAALGVCLEVPDAAERWLAGEAVFANARLD